MGSMNNRYFRALAVVLLLQAAAFYGLASRPENVPYVAPLSTFPAVLGGWHMVKDFPVDKEMLEILRADDTLNRAYTNTASQVGAYLFVAYFKTQRYGQSPHSPKNCLPGSGWDPVEGASGEMAVRVAGSQAPITVNRYVVQHGDERSVTLYWYQGHGRVIADEFSAKFWLVADAIRYHRSDTAAIRVTVPVGSSVEAAVATGAQFVQAVFPDLVRHLAL
jgi:EpsI family protein